jgi:hypothetical protein
MVQRAASLLYPLACRMRVSNQALAQRRMSGGKSPSPRQIDSHVAREVSGRVATHRCALGWVGSGSSSFSRSRESREPVASEWRRWLRRNRRRIAGRRARRAAGGPPSARDLTRPRECEVATRSSPGAGGGVAPSAADDLVALGGSVAGPRTPSLYSDSPSHASRLR